jgi:hypothetical protein
MHQTLECDVNVDADDQYIVISAFMDIENSRPLGCNLRMNRDLLHHVNLVNH